MELSNKTLALLIVATVVISLGGTIISLNKLDAVQESGTQATKTQERVTGYASSGKVDVVINSNMSCDVMNNVSFGSAGQPQATYVLSTEKDNTGQNFQNCASGTICSGIEINNTGNVEINVSFNSTVSGSTLVAGQTGAGDSDFMYLAKNGTGTVGATGLEPGCRINTTSGWNNVPTLSTWICRNLTSADANDIMTLEFNVTLEPDVPAGTKTAIINIGCTQAIG